MAHTQPPSVIAARTRHRKSTAVVAALAAALALLLGGGSLARWSAETSGVLPEIHAGRLEVSLATSPTWAFRTGSGQVLDLTANGHLLVPDERIYLAVTWRATMTGDDMTADLILGRVALAGRLADVIDEADSTWGLLAAPAYSAQSVGTAAKAVTASLGQDVPATPLTAADDGRRFTEFLDLAIDEPVTVADLEGRVLDVLNLDARLDQTVVTP